MPFNSICKFVNQIQAAPSKVSDTNGQMKGLLFFYDDINEDERQMKANMIFVMGR